MGPVLRKLLPAFGVLAILPLASCSDEHALTQPPSRAYTTPTGLVTANPPLILAGAGDISTCSNNSDEATAQLLDVIPGTVFTAGDNVMPNGTASEFANCYDPTWGRHKARTRPSAGNHDYGTSGAAGYFAYFGAAAGEPGKGYYSYSLGAWHIVVLNSNIATTAGSAQDTWLKADLAAHPNQCTLAYYHHPLYSSASGSGTGGATLSGVRTFVNDLYAAHADLVMNGHRHIYERIAPMKPDGTADPVLGLRGFIVGTGGDGGGSPTNVFPLSEVRNGDTRGVLKLYLYDDSYAWKFVPIAGKTFTDSGSAACHFSGGGGGGGEVSASQSTVTAAPASIPVGGAMSTITVTVRDGNGNAIAGATVALDATGSGNTLTQPVGGTNAAGQATGTINSTVAETKTITATANGVALTQTATVSVVPAGGPPGPITPTLLASGASGTNAKIYTTASIAPAPNALVTVAVRSRRSSGPLTPTLSGGGMASWTPVTSVDYDPVSGSVARLVVFRAMSPTPGSGPLTITYSSSVSNADWIITQWPGVDESGSNGSGAIGQTGLASGNAVASLSRMLAPFGDANNVALGVLGAATNGPAANPGAGFSEIVETTSGENTLLEMEWGTNLNTIQAGLSRTANAALVAIEIRTGSGTGPAVSATLSGIVAEPSTIAAGGASTIGVTVKDGDGAPMAGITVTLTATGSGNSITQPAGTTDEDGNVTGTFSSTGAGIHTITAVAGGVTLGQQARVTVNPGPVDANQSMVTALPTSIIQGSGTSTITVTVKDAFGNAVAGSLVVLHASGSGNTLTGGGTTDASGVVTGSLGSTVAETKTVSATAGVVDLAQTATVTVTPEGSGGSGTITPSLLTSGHDPNNVRIYTTGAIAPAANSLVLVAVLTHQASAAAPSPTLTGGGMTSWDIVASVAFNGATPLDRLTVYRAMSAAPGAGPITITSSVTVSNCQWIVSQWSGADDAGVNGAGAIVQTAQTSGTAVNGLTAMLAPFGDGNNVGYGAFGVASATAVVIPGSGFTTIDQQPSGEGTTGDLFAEWAGNQPAVSASWTSKSGGVLALEIRSKPLSR